MAAAVLSGAASAAAHNVSLFFNSLFLLIVDAVRHALNLFPSSPTRKDGLNSADRSTAHTSKQRALEEMGIAPPPFTAASASASASSSTAAAAAVAAPTASAADATSTASAMSSSRQPKKSTPRVVPALPRIPPVGRSDVTMSGRSSQQDLDELVSGMAAVHLDGSPKPDAGPGNQVAAAPFSATLPTRAQSDSSVSSDSFAGGGKAVSSTAPEERDAGDPSRSDAGDLINEVGSTLQTKFDFSSKTEEELRIHGGFMEEALDMARLALKTNETPVGCVLVYHDRIIARGMNATNITRNGTRHAELMAISALISHTSASDLEDKTPAGQERRDGPAKPLADRTNGALLPLAADSKDAEWVDVDPTDGHLYPYGQKLHPSPRVDRTLISECVLYVTVEPCVMCASLLRQLRIKKVYFGAVNDKFGGTGGVFRIHKNSTVCPQPIAATALPAQREVASSGGSTTGLGPGDVRGDGGTLEPGYDVEGGWGRDEAVTLLRQFYVQENGRAPAPRKKEGRAARLAALMERDGQTEIDETPTQDPDDEVPPLDQPGLGSSTLEPKEAASDEGSYSDAPDDSNTSS